MKLADKVAIVGGASRGIGKDIAVALAAEGAKVVVAARSEVEPDPRLPGTMRGGAYRACRATAASTRRSHDRCLA